ncbi:MAG: Gfo/Idh/MocA family protein [Anaerolineales bacterium]
MSQTPLRIGVVGCGNVTVKRHIPAVNRLEAARVVAVADQVDARVAAARAVASLPESQSFDSFSAMADACELDYVLVAVPPSVRRAIVDDAFERGLDVLSEKPLATRLYSLHDRSERGNLFELSQDATVHRSNV